MDERLWESARGGQQEGKSKRRFPSGMTNNRATTKAKANTEILDLGSRMTASCWALARPGRVAGDDDVVFGSEKMNVPPDGRGLNSDEWVYLT